MAEGGIDHTRKPKKVHQLCRYFIHGACELGDQCRFLHDRTGSAAPSNVCRFYQKGNCSYGQRCRYDHVRSDQQSDRRETRSQRQIRSRREPPNSQNEIRSQQSASSNRNQSKEKSENSRESSMVALKMGGVKERPVDKKQQEQRRKKYIPNWVKAKDFVPGEKFHAGATYAKAAHSGEEDPEPVPDLSGPQELQEEDLLCPYYAHGHCPYQPSRSYVHGDVCDICQLPRLHPTNTAQREEHQKECLQEMEKDMEHSFAVQESQDKECCICLESILEKAEKEKAGAAMSKSDELFGILENCNHCFCLSCIRRWRSDKSFGKSVRQCPICRVHSNFVTPSNIWVEDEDKKKKIIQDYKNNLSSKTCRYFREGKGHCPFNARCFYKHAYPDGSVAKPEPHKPRRRVDANGEVGVVEGISLWDFLEHREDGILSLEDELSLFLLGMLQDSDDEDGLVFGGWESDVTSDSDSDYWL